MSTYGQLSPLQGFSIVQDGDVVEVRFAIRGGASCNGVDLERSVDSLSYSLVAFIPGVCGGSAFTEYYDILDAEPIVGQKVFYRLKLGGQGYSEPRAFTFIRLGDGVTVFPNPTSDVVRIKLDNPGSIPWSVAVHFGDGRLYKEFNFSGGDEALFSVAEWSSQVYFLRIAIGESTLVRRLQVQ